jgi:hypothetical protein
MNGTIAPNRNGRRAVRRAGVIALLLASAGLLAAGCGDNATPDRAVASVAAPAGDSSASPQPSSSGSGDPVAFAKCMRANGLPEFPDPDAGGGIMFGGPNAKIDPNSAEYKKAAEKCAAYAPSGQPNLGSPQDQWSSADKLKYAKCMRESGVPSFPDPDASGGFAFGKDAGVDPESPQFKAAEKTCAQYKPQGAQQPQGGTIGGAK